MTRLTINNLNYNVLTWGEGIPIVLLHGFTGSASSWGQIAHSLSQTHKVIAIDLLGHGDSDKPADLLPYTFPNMGCDLMKLLGALVNAPVHLLGYSMGGRVALYLAQQFPHLFQSLILESASPGLLTVSEREERAHSDNALADRIEQEGMAAFVDFWEQLPLWENQPPPLKAVQRLQRLNNHPQGLANSLRGAGTGVQPSLWASLPQVNLPVQLITGGLDHKFTALNQQMATLLPHAHHEIIDHAGHNTHLDAPDEFTRQVRGFLAQV